MSVQGTLATSGDHTILPAITTAYRLREITIQLEGSNATTVLVKFGVTTWRRIYLASQGASFGIVYDTLRPMPTNNALIFNLDGNNQINYFVDYEV